MSDDPWTDNDYDDDRMAKHIATIEGMRDYFDNREIDGEIRIWTDDGFEYTVGKNHILENLKEIVGEGNKIGRFDIEDIADAFKYYRNKAYLELGYKQKTSFDTLLDRALGHRIKKKGRQWYYLLKAPLGDG